MPEGSPWLIAGRVGRPHGLDGSFYVTRPRAALLDAGSEILVGDEAAEIVRRAGTGEKPILRLSCADSRDAVEKLRGQDLKVPRTVAPALEEDEWYAEDLVGCDVVDVVGGAKVGVVLELMALPSCEALVVQRAAEGPDLLVPLVADCVRAVDLDAERIDIDLEFLGEKP